MSDTKDMRCDVTNEERKAVMQTANNIAAYQYERGLRAAAQVCRVEARSWQDERQYDRADVADMLADAIERLKGHAGAGERVPRERVAAPAPALHRPLCNVNFVHPEIAAQRRTSTHGDGATVTPGDPLTARQAAEVRVPSQFERAQDDEHEERRAPPPTCPRCGQTVSGEHLCGDILGGVCRSQRDEDQLRAAVAARVSAARAEGYTEGYHQLVEDVVAQKKREAAAVEAARREERKACINRVNMQILPFGLTRDTFADGWQAARRAIVVELQIEAQP